MSDEILPEDPTMGGVIPRPPTPRPTFPGPPIRPIDDGGVWHEADDRGGYSKAFVVYWDERLPLPAEGRARLEREIRRAVLAELASTELDDDVAITSVRDPEVRGMRIRKL